MFKSPVPQFKSINSLLLGLLYGSTLMSQHDYWKKHSFDFNIQTFKMIIKQKVCEQLKRLWCMLSHFSRI